MRVTGGKARGIQLRVPSGPVRPATDYLRESVFNSLAAFIPGARVLDLFAGTGSYALESLSRGARSAVCVDRLTADVIRQNAAAVAKSMTLDGLPLDVVTGDALAHVPAAADFDLVFVDPPWELWEREAGALSSAAAAAAAPGDDARLILEAPGGFTVPVPEGWRLHKTLGKGKGQPAATILRRV
jgi:16S rRNA (guanine966-N2)-methyltransferase